MKNRPSATGDLVAATPSQEAKVSKSKRGQRSKQKHRSEPLCDLRHAVKGMVFLDETKAGQFIRKDSIENSFVLDEKPFASGLFATVRRVRDKATGVIYAAKYAARDRYGVDSTADIMHELGLLSVCRPCPRIVRLHAAYDTPADLILVMDYACGGDLQTVLDADIIPFEHDAARFTKQLMEALVFLHDRNIVHLDIKPQNLVLTGPFPDCDIKLCDLEISRVVSEEEQIREILGTPDYVAPEILHFEPISLAADIWSTGVLAYVLLTGFTPFGGDTDQETFCNISRCHVDFPNELFEDVSDNAKNFIQWLLVRSPKDRPFSRDCLRHPWLGYSRKPHEKETIASEAQRKNPPGGGCPRSSSSMQHLALQRNNLTKSREILLDRVASLSNLRKSTSKSRERLCEMRLSLSRSRDHLLDIQRAVSASKEGMGPKLLSRSQEFLSHKLHSPNTSTRSEANEYSFSLDMSPEKAPSLISPKVEKSTDLVVARGQSFCQSSEVLGQPLVEVPEEEDENQDKAETEINIDQIRTDPVEKKKEESEIIEAAAKINSDNTEKLIEDGNLKPLEIIKKNQKLENETKAVESKAQESLSKAVENTEKVFENQLKSTGNNEKHQEHQIKQIESKVKTLENHPKLVETKEKSQESKQLESKLKASENQPKLVDIKEKTQEHHPKQLESKVNQLKPVEIKEKPQEHQSKQLDNKAKVLESQPKPVETKDKVLESPSKQGINQDKTLDNQKTAETKEKSIVESKGKPETPGKLTETKEKARMKLSDFLSAPSQIPKNEEHQKNQCEEAVRNKAENGVDTVKLPTESKQKLVPNSAAVKSERGSSDRQIAVVEDKSKAVQSVIETKEQKMNTENEKVDVSTELKQDESNRPRLVRKTSRHELVLKLETTTPPTTPTTILTDPFSQSASSIENKSPMKKVDELTKAFQEQSEVDESSPRPFTLSKPKRPPPIEVTMQSLPSVPSPPTDAVKEEPGTPRAYFLDKLRSFRDKLTQSIQRQSSDGAKTSSQPTSPLSETPQKIFVDVPEDEQKIPAELLNRRRASWAHGLRQEAQVEQKPSVAQLAQNFLVTKSEPIKGLSVVEPRKLKLDWRRSESTESLNEKNDKPIVQQSRKLRSDWRKPDEEKVEKHEVKIQEEEKPSKPIASIALAFEMAAVNQSPSTPPVKSKVPLTPPVRRKNSFERSRPAQLMAEVTSLPKLLEVTSPREEDESIPAAFERKVEEVKARPKSVEILTVVRKAIEEKPVVKHGSTSESVVTNQAEKKASGTVVLLRKKKEKSRDSNDVCSQTLDTDFSKKGESCDATQSEENECSTSTQPSGEDKPTTSKHTRSGSVSSDTGCSELSSDALSDRSSTASAGDWEDGDKKRDTKSAETQTSSLEDVSGKIEWRGRNRSHSVQADLSFIAQPWGRVCTGSVARAFEKFGSKGTEKSRSFRIRRQSTIL